MRTKLFNAIKVSALATLLSFGLSFVYAWTAPTSNPPAGNVSAPINTSGTAQMKSGGFTVGTTTPTGLPSIFTAIGSIYATDDVCTALGGGKCLSTAGSGGAFGPGYTWQNMIGSAVGCAGTRAMSVTCTNSTGNPIMVSVYVTGTSATSVQISDNGLAVSTNADHGCGGCGVSAGTVAIIPSGHNYVVTGGALSDWKELRCDSGLNCGSGSNVPGSLGVGQSWQNMLASRASGVTYTNATGKPIVVAVGSGAAPSLYGNYITLYVNGVKVADSMADCIGYCTSPQSATTIVPAGSTYEAVATPNLNFWSELR